LTESNHRLRSSVINSSQRRPSAALASGLENGDADSPSTLESPRSRTAGKRVLPPITRQTSRPIKQRPSIDEGYQPTSGTPLGPVNPSKVSKSASKNKVRQRRQNFSEYMSSGSLLLSPGMDAAVSQASPDHATRRRSRRIQPHPPIAANGPVETASTSPPKRSARSKPVRDVASNPITRSPTKRQGVSKGKPAKTRRGKAEKG
jgi:hypothetical protein